MGAEYYTSDWHFGHAAQAARRGFASVTEHDEVILANVNKAARRNDAVYVLGDLAVSSPERLFELVARIAADVHAILGNHDRPHPEHRGSERELRRWAESGVFASVSPAGCRMLAGRKVMLSHFPYEGEGERDIPERYSSWRLRDTGRVLLHGHIHTSWKLHPDPRPPMVLRDGEWIPGRRQIHVGVDAWGMRPVPRSEIEKIINLQFGRALAVTAASGG